MVLSPHPTATFPDVSEHASAWAWAPKPRRDHTVDPAASTKEARRSMPQERTPPPSNSCSRKIGRLCGWQKTRQPPPGDHSITWPLMPVTRMDPPPRRKRQLAQLLDRSPGARSFSGEISRAGWKGPRVPPSPPTGAATLTMACPALVVAAMAQQPPSSADLSSQIGPRAALQDHSASPVPASTTETVPSASAKQRQVLAAAPAPPRPKRVAEVGRSKVHRAP
mmetsp:Transcript_3838/g.11525  ORF Transcript_3838/g.11525 Transcript_3838/m.11525 type:complete len:223 (+) Transcript_3838:1030-1698(+)